MVTDDKLKKIFEKGPIILDDFLGKDIEDRILQQVIRKAEFMLGDTYEGTSGRDSQDIIKKYKINNLYEQPQLCHVSKNLSNTTTISSNFLYPYLTYPLINACIKLNFNVVEESIWRIKTNLQTRAPEFSRGKYNIPHIDSLSWDKHLMTAIYYLNDSDGDTYFFKGDINQINYELLKFDNVTKERAEFLSNLQILSSISPKKGRMVIFPITWLHAGSHPIDYNTRIVTNYNFGIEII